MSKFIRNMRIIMNKFVVPEGGDKLLIDVRLPVEALRGIFIPTDKT